MCLDVLIGCFLSPHFSLNGVCVLKLSLCSDVSLAVVHDVFEIKQLSNKPVLLCLLFIGALPVSELTFCNILTVKRAGPSVVSPRHLETSGQL